jgi:carbonic anhydrase
MIIKINKLVLLIVLFLPNMCFAVPNWSYDDDYTGQEEWGNLKGGALCSTGTQQSPIVISYTKSANLPPLNFGYISALGELNTSEKSFIVNIKNGGVVAEGKNVYNLQKIELHSPSEHEIRDKISPLEIHLIHKNKNGEILIVAIFANLGDENPAFAAMLNNIKQRFTINTNDLLPKATAYYAYNGSLPYPPCSEGVKWRVIKSSITISKAQLTAITAVIGRNARLPQPVYMRQILETN